MKSHLLTPSYDLFIVGIVVPIMNFIYPQNAIDPQLVTTAALIGAICGQLTFGFVADLTGTRFPSNIAGDTDLCWHRATYCVRIDDDLRGDRFDCLVTRV